MPVAMAKKKPSVGQLLADMRWKSATPQDKAEAARHRALGRWARWRAEHGKPPKPGDEKFVELGPEELPKKKRPATAGRPLGKI
jgi:hypothetical protein